MQPYSALVLTRIGAGFAVIDGFADFIYFAWDDVVELAFNS